MVFSEEVKASHVIKLASVFCNFNGLPPARLILSGSFELLCKFFFFLEDPGPVVVFIVFSKATILPKIRNNVANVKKCFKLINIYTLQRMYFHIVARIEDFLHFSGEFVIIQLFQIGQSKNLHLFLQDKNCHMKNVLNDRNLQVNS